MHAQQQRVCHLVAQAFEEGGLQLRHKWLQAWPSLADEEAQGVQDGRLDLPGEAVTNDADEAALQPPQAIGLCPPGSDNPEGLNFHSICCHTAVASVRGRGCA